MKIKFNSDDDLPFNKPLKFYAITKIIRSVFEEGGKLHSQVFLDECLYEFKNVTVRKMFQKELASTEQSHPNKVCVVIIDILTMLDLDFNHLFVINAMMF